MKSQYLFTTLTFATKRKFRQTMRKPKFFSTSPGSRYRITVFEVTQRNRPNEKIKKQKSKKIGNFGSVNCRNNLSSDLTFC